MKTRLLLAVLFFVSQVVLGYATESNLWTERNKSFQLAKLPTPVPVSSSFPQNTLQSLKKTYPALRLSSIHSQLFEALPTRVGSIRDVITPPGAKTNKIVFHIQDVHQNDEAQKNIGAAVQALIDQDLVDLVALEGAFDEIDVAPFRKFSDQNAIHKVADYLLRLHKISGPVHTAFTSAKKIPRFVGVDEKSLYEANVKAYQAAAPQAKPLQIQLENNIRQNKKAKNTVFNPALKTFDEKVQAFRATRLKLGAYLTYLAQQTDSVSINIEVFLEALALESELDYDAVKTERAFLISSLFKQLSSKEQSDLMTASSAYHLNQVGHSEFYRFIKTLCAENNIPLSRYPEMVRYIQYILLSESIDPNQLLTETKNLEQKIYKTLIKTNGEAELVTESNSNNLASKLLTFSLTSNEWRDYQNPVPLLVEEGPGVEHYNPLPLLKEEQAINTQPWPFPKGKGTDVVGKGTELRAFEDFYRIAEERDHAITENLLNEMEESSAKVAILVTGGFHANGIHAKLKSAGITTLSFTPKITKVESNNKTSYLSVFSQEKTPLDRLFEGKPLFLTQNPKQIALFSTLVGLFKKGETAPDGVSKVNLLNRTLKMIQSKRPQRIDSVTLEKLVESDAMHGMAGLPMALVQVDWSEFFIWFVGVPVLVGLVGLVFGFLFIHWLYPWPTEVRKARPKTKAGLIGAHQREKKAQEDVMTLRQSGFRTWGSLFGMVFLAIGEVIGYQMYNPDVSEPTSIERTVDEPIPDSPLVQEPVPVERDEEDTSPETLIAPAENVLPHDTPVPPTTEQLYEMNNKLLIEMTQELIDEEHPRAPDVVQMVNKFVRMSRSSQEVKKIYWNPEDNIRASITHELTDQDKLADFYLQIDLVFLGGQLHRLGELTNLRAEEARQRTAGLPQNADQVESIDSILNAYKSLLKSTLIQKAYTFVQNRGNPSVMETYIQIENKYKEAHAKFITIETPTADNKDEFRSAVEPYVAALITIERKGMEEAYGYMYSQGLRRGIFPLWSQVERRFSSMTRGQDSVADAVSRTIELWELLYKRAEEEGYDEQIMPYVALNMIFGLGSRLPFAERLESTHPQISALAWALQLEIDAGRALPDGTPHPEDLIDIDGYDLQYPDRNYFPYIYAEPDFLNPSTQDQPGAGMNAVGLFPSMMLPTFSFKEIWSTFDLPSINIAVPSLTTILVVMAFALLPALVTTSYRWTVVVIGRNQDVNRQRALQRFDRQWERSYLSHFGPSAQNFVSRAFHDTEGRRHFSTPFWRAATRLFDFVGGIVFPYSSPSDLWNLVQGFFRWLRMGWLRFSFLPSFYFRFRTNQIIIKLDRLTTQQEKERYVERSSKWTLGWYAWAASAWEEIQRQINMDAKRGVRIPPSRYHYRSDYERLIHPLLVFHANVVRLQGHINDPRDREVEGYFSSLVTDPASDDFPWTTRMAVHALARRYGTLQPERHAEEELGMASLVHSLRAYIDRVTPPREEWRNYKGEHVPTVSGIIRDLQYITDFEALRFVYDFATEDKYAIWRKDVTVRENMYKTIGRMADRREISPQKFRFNLSFFNKLKECLLLAAENESYPKRARKHAIRALGKLQGLNSKDIDRLIEIFKSERDTNIQESAAWTLLRTLVTQDAAGVGSDVYETLKEAMTGRHTDPSGEIYRHNIWLEEFIAEFLESRLWSIRTWALRESIRRATAKKHPPLQEEDIPYVLLEVQAEITKGEPRAVRKQKAQLESEGYVVLSVWDYYQRRSQANMIRGQGDLIIRFQDGFMAKDLARLRRGLPTRVHTSDVTRSGASDQNDELVIPDKNKGIVVLGTEDEFFPSDDSPESLVRAVGDKDPPFVNLSQWDRSKLGAIERAMSNTPQETIVLEPGQDHDARAGPHRLERDSRASRRDPDPRQFRGDHAFLPFSFSSLRDIWSVRDDPEFWAAFLDVRETYLTEVGVDFIFSFVVLFLILGIFYWVAKQKGRDQSFRVSWKFLIPYSVGLVSIVAASFFLGQSLFSYLDNRLWALWALAAGGFVVAEMWGEVDNWVGLSGTGAGITLLFIAILPLSLLFGSSEMPRLKHKDSPVIQHHNSVADDFVKGIQFSAGRDRAHSPLSASDSNLFEARLRDLDSEFVSFDAATFAQSIRDEWRQQFGNKRNRIYWPRISRRIMATVFGISEGASYQTRLTEELPDKTLGIHILQPRGSHWNLKRVHNLLKAPVRPNETRVVVMTETEAKRLRDISLAAPLFDREDIRVVVDSDGTYFENETMQFSWMALRRALHSEFSRTTAHQVFAPQTMTLVDERFDMALLEGIAFHIFDKNGRAYRLGPAALTTWITTRRLLTTQA